jgi:Flp pilus assembly protein CpaB
MKRPQREDVISILAIGFGATLSFGITAAFFEEGRDDAAVRVVVRSSPSRAPEPAMVIPDGYRAVTVRTEDLVAVGGWMRPGSRVDVMGTPEDAPADVEPTPRVFLRNVRVLGNDRSISRDANGQVVQEAFVTLLVTAADAESLSMAAARGRLYFALWNAPPASLLSR